jgi:hypothetical protein
MRLVQYFTRCLSKKSESPRIVMNLESYYITCTLDRNDRGHQRWELPNGKRSLVVRLCRNEINTELRPTVATQFSSLVPSKDHFRPNIRIWTIVLSMSAWYWWSFQDSLMSFVDSLGFACSAHHCDLNPLCFARFRGGAKQLETPLSTRKFRAAGNILKIEILF